jgi:predicted dehydrogenase
MAGMRVAVVGAGFWAGYQVAAWGELPDVERIAICDTNRAKAEQLAARFAIPHVYDDAAEMIAAQRPDLLDIVTDVPGHAPLVRLAAEHRVPVVCQKPLAATLAECEDLVRVCREAATPLAVHENWRWQAPLRYVMDLLHQDAIGPPFRARIDMISGFDVFANQPYLRDIEQFILADMGCHLFDLARSYFGDFERLYCQTASIGPGIRGENVATTILSGRDRQLSVLVQMAYARTPLERECFPQTLVFIEGQRGSIEVAPDYVVRLTDSAGTRVWRIEPPGYAWANPAYAVAHASIVACHGDMLRAWQSGTPAETSGADNLKSMRMVFAAYESAATGQAVLLRHE